MKAWLSFPLIIILTSCISIGTGANVSGGAEQPPVIEQQQPVSERQQNSEITLQEQSDSGLWISGPLNGRFVIIGVSGRLTRANDEIEAAKQDAARKVSMYYGIQGSVESSNTSGSGGFFDYSANSKIELNYNTNYDSYISNLSFDPDNDVMRTSSATYVRFSYNAVSVDFNYSPERSNNRPGWVNGINAPVFSGYTTVVGFAGRRSRLRDTINASCESAIAMLIEIASFQINTDTFIHNERAFSSTLSRSEGRLGNFQILAFWIDPVSGGVSTLAAARIIK